MSSSLISRTRTGLRDTLRPVRFYFWRLFGDLRTESGQLHKLVMDGPFRVLSSWSTTVEGRRRDPYGGGLFEIHTMLGLFNAAKQQHGNAESGRNKTCYVYIT